MSTPCARIISTSRMYSVSPSPAAWACFSSSSRVGSDMRTSGILAESLPSRPVFPDLDSVVMSGGSLYSGSRSALHQDPPSHIRAKLFAWDSGSLFDSRGVFRRNPVEAPLLNRLIPLDAELGHSSGQAASELNRLIKGSNLGFGWFHTKDLNTSHTSIATVSASRSCNDSNDKNMETISMGDSTIHARIRALRQRAHLSMQAVASGVGASSWQTVQQWEKGKTAPSRTRLVKLASVLNTTPEYLMFGNTALAEQPDQPARRASNGPLPITPGQLDQILNDLASLSEADRDIWVAELHLAALRHLKETQHPPDPRKGKVTRSA